MEVIPPGWLPPGTDSSTGLPFCGRDHGNGDPVQAMLLRVWALMSRETMAGDRLRPGTAPRLPVSRMAIRQDFADRAWLDGGPKGIDEKFCRVVPESENHQWMIRTTRFLHNELLGVAHRIPPGGKYSWMNDYSDDQPNLDNGSNGAGAALRAKLEEWPKTDFLEYNARPYSYYQMIGLLNLFDFTRTRDMHYRAQEVLDFLSVKQAVESQDRARTAPFRRREEAGFEHGDLLDDDPLASMYQVWIGGETTTLTYPRKNELILAASSDYRPPRVLMQQMLGRRTRSDYETFNGKGQAEAGFAGPDFTITGGGFRTDCPYPTSPAEKALSFGLLPNCVGDGNSHGSTRPIVLLIHRNAMKQPPGGSWLDDAIHIDDYPYPSNLVCIYRNFACGPIVRIGRDLPGGSCKQTGTDGSGDPYTAIRLDDFVGRCHLAGETDPGQTCLYVYIVHKVPRYHDNAEDGSPIPKPMSYFVTHTCEHSQQLLDPNRPVRDRHPLVINSSQPAFSDFVDYMKTVGAPRVVPDRTGGELAIRLPAESGPIAPDQEIRVQSSILIDGTVPPYLLLSPAYSGASLAGTLAHLDDRGDLVIGPPGDQYTIGPSGIHLS
jgi:hypothetical protein